MEIKFVIKGANYQPSITTTNKIFKAQLTNLLIWK